MKSSANLSGRTLNANRFKALRRAASNAVSDAERGCAMMEAVEPRRLFAFVASGTPGILAASGVQAVESAAAQPDTTNHLRYASYVTTANLGFVDPVAGVNSQTPVQPALAINSAAGDTVSNTDVAANTTNNLFVVVWQNTHTPANPPGSPADSDIYAQVYSNNIAVGTPIVVNSTTAGNQTNCRVAMDGSGNFTVVWEAPVGGATQVVARRFSSTGTALSAEIQISTTAVGGVEPDVAMNNAGVTAITWATSAGTVAQLFNANLTTIGSQVAVSSDTFAEPAVGVANNGTYLVAYSATVNAVKNIMVQRYTASGIASGAAFAAAVDTTANQNVPQVAVDTGGNFAIGWAQATVAAPATYAALAFRVFHANGTAYGNETVISGVRFGADNRFGLAFRVPGELHVAYADAAGEALMQTFADNTPVVPPPTPPAGAVAVTAAASGSTIVITNNSSTITVVKDGVTTNYSRGTYSSVFVTGSDTADSVDMRGFSLPSSVFGNAGNDTIIGGSGADNIDAGDGDDQVQGNAGNDTIYGGDGDDALFGAAGNDRILGGPGKNVLYGEDGFDTLIAGNRGDIMYGGAAGDSLVGGSGGDYMNGGSSNDILQGMGGSDRLFGGNGNDYLDGGDGNDSVVGNGGTDFCYGGGGDDTLVGAQLADTLRGGGGNDYAYFDKLDTLISVTFRILVK